MPAAAAALRCSPCASYCEPWQGQMNLFSACKCSGMQGAQTERPRLEPTSACMATCTPCKALTHAACVERRPLAAALTAFHGTTQPKWVHTELMAKRSISWLSVTTRYVASPYGARGAGVHKLVSRRWDGSQREVNPCMESLCMDPATGRAGRGEAGQGGWGGASPSAGGSAGVSSDRCSPPR